MCNQHTKSKRNYHGSSLVDGAAHEKDHQKLSRRQFMSMGSLFAAGSLLLQNTPITSLLPNAFSNAVSNSNSDNILVLIRLHGGNDGLNTVIPHSTDVGRTLYETYRPNVKLQHNTHYTDNQILSAYNHTLGTNSNAQFAFPTQMDPLMNLWNNNKMSIIHNVGYPNSNGSHFLSSDYWSTGVNSNSNELYQSGWMGRYLDFQLPCFSVKPPATPPAILIGNTSDLSFVNPGGTNMALTFTDVAEFNSLVSNGELYSNSGIPNDGCASNVERRFLREVANNAFSYNNNIQTAYSSSEPFAYPAGNTLSNQLAILGRLIKGGLGTRVYMVSLGGFDTHNSQMGNHQALLGKLAEAVNAFYDDLLVTGHQEKVLVMGYSEFGRTVRDNSQGTDHGTLGPVMLWGDGLNGGFHGTPMKLDDPDLVAGAGNVNPDFGYQEYIDFRGVYATVLQDWLCLHPETINCMFAGSDFNRVPDLIGNPCTASATEFENAALFAVNRKKDNANIIQIKYALRQKCAVKIQLLNQGGGVVRTLVEALTERNTYTYNLDWQADLISPGTYICRMQYGGAFKERKLILQ